MSPAIRITQGIRSSIDSYTELSLETTLQTISRITKEVYCEVLHEDSPDPKKPHRSVGFCRPYGDFDMYCVDEADMKYKDECMLTAMKTAFASGTRPNANGDMVACEFSMMTASGFSHEKQKWKSSWRFVVAGLYGTKQMSRVFVEEMIVPKINEELAAINAGFTVEADTSIYNSGRKMRMLHSDKPGEGRPLRLVYGTPEDTLITYIPEYCVGPIFDSQPTVSTSTVSSKQKSKNAKEVTLTYGQHILTDFDYEGKKKLADLIALSYIEDYGVCIKLMMALWNTERSERMEDVIVMMLQKSAKFDPVNGRNWIRKTVAAADQKNTFATIAHYAKLSDPAGFKEVVKAHPYQYYEELFQQSLAPTTEEYCERFVRSLPIQQYNTIVLQSQMGTGKTYQIMGDADKNIAGIIVQHKRILYISGRKSFTSFAYGEMKERGFNFESYDQTQKSLSSVDRLFIQVESLWKLKNGFAPYDLVVVDESETICHQLHSITTHKDHMIDNHEVMGQIIATAKKVIAADAFITDRTFSLLRELRGTEGMHFIKNTFQPYQREAIQILSCEKDHRVANLAKFAETIMERVNAGKKVAIVWTSRKRGKAFAEQFLEPLVTSRNLRYRFYSGESNAKDRKELQNVNETWRHLDVLMYSTAITIGVNYNPENVADRFDELFLYACSSSALPRDIAQSLLRCRYINANRLTYVCELRTAMTPVVGMEATKEYFSAKTNYLSLIKGWKEIPAWAEKNFLYNENEKRISHNEYLRVLHEYLQRSGYTLKTEGGVSTLDVQSSTEIPYDEIPKIDSWDAQDIEFRIMKDEADVMERLSLKKFKFLQLLRDDITEERAMSIWESYMLKPETESRFWNIINEKVTTVEQTVNKELRERYAIMAKRTMDQRIRLVKVLDLLQMKSTQDAKQLTEQEMTVLLPQLKEMEQDIRHVFGLNKTERKGEFTVQNAHDLLNSVFYTWCGAKFKAETQRKQLNGKRIRHYEYILTQQIIEEESGLTLWAALK
jgi:hypothetical protein